MTKTNQQILLDAPDGATHYEGVDKKYKDRTIDNYRSLADIERIVELEARVAELERELNQRKTHFVGYTNGNQIAYAKDDVGSFYPGTDNDCYIPLYMLDIHLHRLGGTASQEWMEEQLRKAGDL